MGYGTVHLVVRTNVSEEHDYVVCRQIRGDAEAAIWIRSIGTLNCFTFATRGSGYIFSPNYLHMGGLVIFDEHHGATG
jgi:hypothetical protein